MGSWYPTATTVRGVRGDIESRLNAFPQIWPQHVSRKDSTTQVEPFAWSGAVPKPRKMEDGRRIVGLSQFTYNIENSEYELSLLVDRKTFEDQQTSGVQQKIQELTQAWGPLKDEILVEMLENGGGTTKGAPYDGNSFFHDTRSEGKSGTIDNNTTSVAAADDAVPTPDEFLEVMKTIRNLMATYADDQGRKGTNFAAMMRTRVIAPWTCEKSIRTALQSTLINNTDNVFGRNLCEPDFDPYLTVTATQTDIFVHAVGAEDFRGVIYQERTPLEVVIYDDPHWMDYHNGLLITLRQRFAFAYGNFRRMVRHRFTT